MQVRGQLHTSRRFTPGVITPSTTLNEDKLRKAEAQKRK
jgi:hypothetical protein